MSFLVVGGVTIPVAPGGGKVDVLDAVDRGRAFDNTYRASATGGAAKEFHYSSPPVQSGAIADNYKALLRNVSPQMCSGDGLGNPMMCCTELLGWTQVKAAAGLYEVIDFALHEVQPAKLLLKYAPGDTITGESFSRTGVATYYDSNGVLQTASTGVKRDSHYINGVRSLLLEDASTNICLQSENFGATWGTIGTPTRVAGNTTGGGISMDLLGDDSAAALEGYFQTITFTGNAVKAVSVYIRNAGTSTSSVIRLVDNTAGVNRLLATVTWGGDGRPVVTMTTGTYLGLQAWGVSYFRLLFQTTSVTAANSNELHLYPATTAALAVGNTGTVEFGGIQAENKPFPTSYIKTTTTSATRNADLYVLPFPFPEMELTVLIQFVESGTAVIGGARLFEIGTGGAIAPTFLADAQAQYRSYHGEATANVASVQPAASPMGASVDFLARLFGNGSTDNVQAINAGAESPSTQTSGIGLAEFSSRLCALNSGASGANAGFVAIQSFKIVAGARSLQEMRAA